VSQAAGARKLAQRARLLLGLRAFLSEPLTLDDGLAQLRKRVEDRDARFVESMRQLVYDHAASPYAALLRWAGCELGDVESSVRAHGVDPTLATLAESGVRLSLDEFKSRTPIIRSGLTLVTAPRDFDNPIFLGKAVTGSTSGTTGDTSRVFLDWDGLAEEAANELVLYAIHGLERSPLALWLPPPPGLAGIRNVLVNARFGRPPARWFSPTPWSSRSHRLATRGLLGACRLFGMQAPRPEFLDPGRAWVVAAWLAQERARGEHPVLSAYTSGAVRVAAAAFERGLDVEGGVVFATGEPLTDRRLRYLEAAGIRAFARYVAAETGMVAGGCGLAAEPDGMHLYVDRIAAIPGTPVDGKDAVLLTTLSRATPKVLLNVDLGDRFRLERRTCGCLFGELGMDLHVSRVRSGTRFTSEGGTVLVAELAEIVGALVERAGGGPDDFQLAERLDQRGLAVLEIVVRPAVTIDPNELIDAVLTELMTRGPGPRTMAALWRESGTLSVVRAEPRRTGGAKLPALVSAEAD
jgi:hypothetical protein